MNARRKWPILAAVAAIGALVFILGPEIKTNNGPGAEDIERVGGAERRIGFLLHQDNSLVFDVPPGSPLIRFISNAIIPAAVTADEKLHYELRYEWLNADKQAISAGRYHHLSRLSWRETEGGPQTANLFLDEDRQPIDGRRALLQPPDGARLIRVHLQSADDIIQGAVLRAYFEESSPERRLAVIWQRLSATQRERLAESNVYPSSLMRESEKLNLVRHSWQPLAPRGLEGTDFKAETIYVSQGEPVTEEVAVEELEGMQFGGTALGILSVSENGANYRLNLKAVGKLPSGSGKIVVSWYGRSSSERSTHSFDWNGDELDIVRQWPGGILEFESSTPVALTVFEIQGDTETDVTPEQLKVRVYETAPNEPINWAITHVDTRATPMRIDLRSIIEPGQASYSAVTATISFQDSNGTELSSQALHFLPEASRYDSPPGKYVDQLISDPQRWYLLAPPDAAFLSIMSDTSILTSMYNRPPDLPVVRRIPDDYFKDSKDDNAIPTWFSVRPLDHDELETQERAPILALQRRPPEDEQSILDGEYLFETMNPEGRWRARDVLTPRDTSRSLRDQALASNYRHMRSGEAVEITLSDRANRVRLKPTLAFARQSKMPNKIELYANGLRMYHGTLRTQHGEIRLPAIAAGKHQFRIQTNADANFYLNYAADDTTEDYLRRSVFVLPDEPLNITFDKRGYEDEGISARLYSPWGSEERTTLNVQITGSSLHIEAVSTEHTFLQRDFDVRPADGKPVPVLNTRGENVDEGRAFSITLGADLPPGRYHVRIFKRSGAARYISLGRITPGLFKERTLHWE